MLHRIHRIIDANLNRVSEGLRVLEDISRFIIEDRESSRRLKAIRHFFSRLAVADDIQLIESRDADGDIGARHDLTAKHDNLAAVIHANARRVQEAIRVLEELSKLPDVKGLSSFTELRSRRYEMYTLAKQLVAKLNQQEIKTRSAGEVNAKTGKRSQKA